MIAVAGIVNTQAQIILLAIPHRTALALWVDPTPTIAPAIVWVVETGIPKPLAKNNMIAPPVSAQNPPTGFNLVSFCPIVRTIRQPPNMVPKAIAK